MTNLFSDTWMRRFSELWNSDDEMLDTLAGTEFSAVIGYGLMDADKPSGMLCVEKGKVLAAGEYQSGELDWDLRADMDSWRDWLQNGLGIDRFGYMIAHKKLMFQRGDPRNMMRKLNLSRAFLRSFELMGQIETEWK